MYCTMKFNAPVLQQILLQLMMSFWRKAPTDNDSKIHQHDQWNTGLEVHGFESGSTEN